MRYRFFERYNLAHYHYIRYLLKKYGYISNGPKNVTCGNDFNQGNCYICSGDINFFQPQSYKEDYFIILAAHVCSKTDPLTGLTKQEFETPYTLPHAIGGWIPVSMSFA